MIYYLEDESQLFIEMVHLNTTGQIQILTDEDDKPVGLAFMRSLNFEPQSDKQYMTDDAKFGVYIQDTSQLYIMLSPLYVLTDHYLSEEVDPEKKQFYKEIRSRLGECLQDIKKSIRKKYLRSAENQSIRHTVNGKTHLVSLIPNSKLLETFTLTQTLPNGDPATFAFGFSNLNVTDTPDVVFTFSNTYDVGAYIQYVCQPLIHEGYSYFDELLDIAEQLTKKQIYVPAHVNIKGD